MGAKFLLVVAACALSIAGCSRSSGHAQSSPSATPQPLAAYAVPGTSPGEIAREVFPGPKGAQFGQSEALPKANVEYVLTVACVAKSASKSAVNYQILDASAGSKPPSPYGRMIMSGSVICHGGARTLVGLPSLPRHPIQVSLTWKDDSVTKAYAVLAP